MKAMEDMRNFVQAIPECFVLHVLHELHGNVLVLVFYHEGHGGHEEFCSIDS